MNKLTVGYIAILCMAAATTARAEGDSEKRDHLFGEAVEFDVVNRFDVVSNRSGGIRRGTGTVNNLDARLMFDGEKLLGVHGSSMLLNVVSGLGGKPNSEYVGTFQGVDSNEVTTNTTKLYQAWIQQTLWNDQLSLLFGLYDLNAEFYATDSAGLFLHPGSGVGVELGQTGVNGPSISPTSSMAFRVKLQPSANWYAQAIVLDGVPGDPNNPRGTHVQFNKGDGTLQVAEVGYLGGDQGTQTQTTQTPSKYALGIWQYTATFDDLVEVDGAGNPIQRDNNRGVYLLAERKLMQEQDDASQGLTGFLRYGIANQDINRLRSYLHTGIVYTGLISGRDSDQLGFSYSVARNGNKYLASQVPADKNETVLELTYLAQANSWLAIQPYLQYVVNPDTNPLLNNATVLGARLELAMSR